MLGAKLDATAYLGRMAEELGRIDRSQLALWADLVFDAWRDGRSVFIFGNGGSGTTATHMSEDLGKSLLRPEHLKDDSRRRLKVMSLTDNLGWILAVGNDCGYDQIFVQQLMNFAGPGDLAIAISGSGNSPNVLEAVALGQPSRPYHARPYGLQRRQAPSNGETRPARPHRRHGHGREHSPDAISLGAERRLRAD